MSGIIWEFKSELFLLTPYSNNYFQDFETKNVSSDLELKLKYAGRADGL
jgi:hypothetical protein